MLGRPGTLKRLLGSKLGAVRRAAYVLVTHTCLRRVPRMLTMAACKVEAEMQPLPTNSLGMRVLCVCHESVAIEMKVSGDVNCADSAD